MSDQGNDVGEYAGKQLAMVMLSALVPQEAMQEAEELHTVVTSLSSSDGGSAGGVPANRVALELAVWLGANAARVLILKASLPALLFQEFINLGITWAFTAPNNPPIDRARLDGEVRTALETVDRRIADLVTRKAQSALSSAEQDRLNALQARQSYIASVAVRSNTTSKAESSANETVPQPQPPPTTAAPPKTELDVAKELMKIADNASDLDDVDTKPASTDGAKDQTAWLGNVAGQ